MPPHVLILGAGAVGLCSAWFCRQRGLRVTVIERNGPERDGCSYGNAGLVVPSHFVPLAAPGAIPLALRSMLRPDSPLYVKPRLSWDLLTWGYRFWKASSPARVAKASPVLGRLLLESRILFEELAEACDDEFCLQQRGLLMLCRTQKGLDAEAHLAEAAHGLGMAAEVLDRQDTASRDPSVTTDVCGSIYFPSDAHLVPQKFVAALQRRLEAAGCEFVWNAEVQGFDVRDRRIVAVRSTCGTREVDQVVLAAGVWSAELARALGLRLPLQAGKGYSLTLSQPRQLPAIPSICVEGRLAVTPMGSALRFGGTMELSGTNSTSNPSRARGIIRSATEFFPEFRPEDFAGVAPWMGLRPLSPDGLPYLGRTSRYRNLCVAAGHAMLGVALAPVSGKIVAGLVVGEPSNENLELLSPDR